MRIGHGFDVHAFGGEGPVVLGGVSIDFDQGLVAHSDGDVVVHALCDALLGAAAMGDIGRLFPDDDSRYAGIDSRRLLREVIQRVSDAGYRVINADLTIIAQKPRLAAHVEDMRVNLASDMGIDVNAVNLKATTTERLGYIGRGEGVATHAVVLLEND